MLTSSASSSEQQLLSNNNNLKFILNEINDTSIYSSSSTPSSSFESSSCIVDPLNHHIYFFQTKSHHSLIESSTTPSSSLSSTKVIAYNYSTRQFVREFHLNIEPVLYYELKMCQQVSETGNIYFVISKSEPVFYRYNIYRDELKKIDKTHEVMSYFYTSMILHQDSIFFYGNQFKSSSSQLVEYKLKKKKKKIAETDEEEEEEMENLVTFASLRGDHNGAFNYEYPDPCLVTMHQKKCIAIGSTSFSCQAFSNGTLDRDLWVFSQLCEDRRIKTMNCNCFLTDVVPYATCYIPYGRDRIAGMIFGGYDEGNDSIVNKVGILVIPLNELETVEQLEWKQFEIPEEILGKINSVCSSFHLIEYVPEKFYKFLVVKKNEIYELNLIFDDMWMIYNSATHVTISHTNSANRFSDMIFKF